ncbi:MAG: hypothetical protein CM15mP104_0420 [Gammaproteobacteria bacterium]|nr:MAG: hypothetical protein CM15mP104_0420 [Gammaproteobacteria bacterium]
MKHWYDHQNRIVLSIDIAVMAEAACKIVDLCEYNTPFDYLLCLRYNISHMQHHLLIMANQNLPCHLQYIPHKNIRFLNLSQGSHLLSQSKINFSTDEISSFNASNIGTNGPQEK